mmetsp:Transcript_49978/g.116678  ORF Transcript_49978/g.116678 Transcript_49978/m.116678 type:complete len:128 (-) Transcript_49978:163-546(-)
MAASREEFVATLQKLGIRLTQGQVASILAAVGDPLVLDDVVWDRALQAAVDLWSEADPEEAARRLVAACDDGTGRISAERRRQDFKQMSSDSTHIEAGLGRCTGPPGPCCGTMAAEMRDCVPQLLVG